MVKAIILLYVLAQPFDPSDCVTLIVHSASLFSRWHNVSPLSYIYADFWVTLLFLGDFMLCTVKMSPLANNLRLDDCTYIRGRSYTLYNIGLKFLDSWRTMQDTFHQIG